MSQKQSLDGPFVGVLMDTIDEELGVWLLEQHLFFVATAPLSPDGHINCSPKGGDAFRILEPGRVGYLDYTGSGAETVAHVRENGRIVLMFCAFDAKPRIVRLYGRASVVALDDPLYPSLIEKFTTNLGARAILCIDLVRVSQSCGYAVPLMDFREDRDILDRSALSKGPAKLAEYRAKKNRISIDGLPAF